ncbi:carbamoyltransferase HypF [Acidianus sp. HS-5]|uniref:carbamoyltransferase HypF n=1 Tax=Acidianus sp. HS-5 TaxID=2886040 RepID=UPI001EFFDFAC|nr:carbamoyltransferase HypF [Acidianus sp. HS-5]BDC17863.1 carbamoyltransferase HypF [Acidianus sp. HS-5]
MKVYRIIFSGIVQGVGFRPFIYRIAVKSGVKGYVRNLGGSEVEVKVIGNEENIGKFMSQFFSKLPPPARIEKIVVEESDIENFNDFKILKSENAIEEPGEIPPDLAVCEDCMREVLDKKDRHYRYPFNSCAYCGPRFSMLYKLPYDRENTSMNDFPMCAHCQREYDDPENERRFDAQGISCPICGPRLSLEDINGERVEGDPIQLTAKLIEEGYVVAIKGIGGFHIAVDPFNDDVVLKLRERKKRPQQPFALMSTSLDVIKKYAEVSEIEESILKSPERPIILLKKKGELSKYVSPGLDRDGHFLYYTPLHYLILDSLKEKISIMTSGNIHGLPMCTDEDCVRKQLRGVVDYILYHNRKILNMVDDSVVRVSAKRVLMLRRSRGFAPTWIRIKGRVEPVIALGAELQNAGAIAFDDKVILTPYIGDTDKLENLEEMEKSIRFFLNTYSMKPKYVIADKNPAYQSLALARKFAEEFSADLIQVQHHYAHGLSVAAEKGIKDGVIIAVDGIGYGDDGNGWGGEVIKFEGGKYTREYHLRYVNYAGGDINAKRPDRMLALFLSNFLSWDEIKKYVKLSENEIKILEMQSKKSELFTSSTGRFLDAVSALLDISHERTYEGEPAIKLEAYARGGKILDFEFPIRGDEIDIVETFKWILDNNFRKEDMAATLQYKLGKALVKVAEKLNPERILVSGGASVNEYILKGILENTDVEVLTNSKVPSGDGGIALGQVYFKVLED